MRRSVIVETKQENILDVDKAQAKSIVLDKIRMVIGRRRKDVENLLIATGSPKAVRSLKPNQFNAAVMNRLAKPGTNGDTFRDGISKLVVVTAGNQVVADGFFKVGTTGLENLYISEEQMAALQSQNVTGYEETPDGGVQETKQGQDVGEILGGSASVLHEIGGIIGLFTGTGQQTAQNNQLNQPWGVTPPPPPPRRTPWTAIIIGLVVVAAIVGVVIYMKKKKK